MCMGAETGEMPTVTTPVATRIMAAPVTMRNRAAPVETRIIAAPGERRVDTRQMKCLEVGDDFVYLRTLNPHSATYE